MTFPAEITPDDFLPHSNPFSTRWVRPGAIPYIFAAGESAENLVQRLREHDWWGQVVGSHGTGKSTLIAALIPHVEQAGLRIDQLFFHRGSRSHGSHRLPTNLRKICGNWTTDTLVVVDGYEQLSRWQRHRLKRTCRQKHCGLLVTSHAAVGLPTIACTTATIETVEQIVSSLVGGTNRLVTPTDVRDCWKRNDQNVRETLFSLYDVYESRRRRAPNRVASTRRPSNPSPTRQLGDVT